MLRMLSLKELEPGMTIAEVDGLWMHHPTLYSKPGVVRSQEEIDAMADQGFTHVMVDLERTRLVPAESAPTPRAVPLGGRPRGRGFVNPVPRKLEMPEAKRALARAHDLVASLVEGVRLGRALDVSGTRVVVKSIMESISRNASCLACLAQLTQHDEYTHGHSVNVAVIAITFGHYLGLSGNELIELGMAGMFHDLGKLKLPGALLRKPGPLTDEEFDLVRKHPAGGLALMEGLPGLNERVTRAVAEHHERFDGSGYPVGLAGDSISLYGRILALSDVYDALTTERPYRHAMPPGEAMALLFNMREREFPPLELELFVKCMGIYPPGSLVRLSSGDVVLVLSNHPDHPLRPTVRLLLSASYEPLSLKTLDLADERVVRAGIKIVGSINPDRLSAAAASKLRAAMAA